MITTSASGIAAWIAVSISLAERTRTTSIPETGTGTSSTATSVTAAVTAVRAAAAGDEFHLILSDIGLPDGTGHDLLRRVRAFTAAPAIALSGFGTDADIRRSEEAGFCRHLVKPVAPDLLEAVIGECLRRAPAGP